MNSLQAIDFRSLLTRLDKGTQATICLPHDPEYPQLLERFSERNVKAAAAIFLPTTAHEISTAVKFVNEHDIDMAVVCGGHASSGASSSEGGLVIDLRRMKIVTVDQEKKTVTCGGGCLWRDVDQALAKYGLATVGGIGGLTLGGGYGFLSGLYGMAIDNLLSLEVVLASGEIVTASNEENQDLFWAMRGAGANFGIATKLTYQAREQKNKVFMGPMAFPPIPSVISGILDFCNTYFASEKEDGMATIIIGISCAPPDFKNPVIMVVGFYNGPEEEGSKFFKPLFDLNPVMNMIAEMPYEEANGVLAKIATHGDRKLAKGFTFTLPLKQEIFMNTLKSYKELTEKFSDDPKIGCSLILFEYISSQKITEFNNGCFANRGHHYNGCFLPRWTIKENDEEIGVWARRAGREVAHNNGGVTKDGREPFYANYDDVLKTSSKDIFGDNYSRLVELKGKFDPNNLFIKWHPLVADKSATV